MPDPNRDLFARVVELLAPLLDELVFVGGCATGMLITDRAGAGIRPTKDVDAVVDASSYAMYAALSARLRALGLTEDATDGAPAWRWRHGDVTVDIVPTDRAILGFSNSWYAPAVAAAERMTIGHLEARLVAPAYFLATKLEAFHGRGHGDVVTSSDLEDIVMVVDGRPQLLAELEAADPGVRGFIAGQFSALLDNRRFTDGLGGFLPPDRASQQRRPLLEKRLRAIAALPRGPA